MDSTGTSAKTAVGLRIPRRPRFEYRERRLPANLGGMRHALGNLNGHDVLLGLIAGSVIASVLALGGARIDWLLWSAPLPLAVSVLAMWLWPARLPAIALALFMLAAYSALQALPLPAPLLERLSPTASETWHEALAATGKGASTWVSVSLDPRASIVEAFKWTLYGGVFLAAASYSQREGSVRIAVVVFASALLVTLVGLAHGLLRAQRLYGFYEPTFTPSQFGIAPLLNPNNLAGYLNLGVFAGLALLLSRRRPLPRGPLVIGICTLIGFSVVAASRAGLVALGLGCALLALLYGSSREASARQAWKSRLMIVSLPVGGFLLATLAGTTETWNDLTSKSLTKLQAIASARHLVADFPWWGTGRGAFESVFPAYRELSGHVVFSHAESFPVQWACGWGLPVAIAMLAFFARQLWLIRRRCSKSKLAACLLIGVCVLLVHNLLDLALELTGISVALFTVLGALWGECMGRPTRGQSATVRWQKPRAIAMAAWSFAAFAACVVWGRQDVAHDREALSAAYHDASATASYQAVLALSKAAIERHPADPFAPLMAGLAAHHLPNVDALPWVARSLARDVASGRAHMVLATILHERGAIKQALMELRLALEAEPALARKAGRFAVRWTSGSPDLLWRVVPRGENAFEALMNLTRAIPAPSPVRLAMLERALALRPNSVDANMMAAESLFTHLSTPDSSVCQAGRRATCISKVREYGQRVETEEPNQTRALELLARLEFATGNDARALKMLADGCEEHQASPSCWKLLITLAKESADSSELEMAAHKYLGVSCTDREACARAAIWLGTVFEQKQRWDTAATYYGRALRESKTTQAWLKFANAVWQSGQPKRALAALNQAEHYSHDPSARRAIRALRTRVDRSRIRR